MGSGGSRGILYLMAKAPEPGRVKTRLCPPLDHGQASALASAFAHDLLQRLSSRRSFELRLAIDDGRSAADFAAQSATAGNGSQPFAARSLADEARRLGVCFEHQGGGDLGARMERLIARGTDADGSPTLLVGADVPDLPDEAIERAFDVLQATDCVLVPARDGGYVAVGARRRVPALFAIDAPWSSAGVLAATTRSLERAGASFEVLAQWEDVDDAAALGRLAARLSDRGGQVAPATARLLEKWRSEGVRF
jgi:hypothetical protein